MLVVSRIDDVLAGIVDPGNRVRGHRPRLQPDNRPGGLLLLLCREVFHSFKS